MGRSAITARGTLGNTLSRAAVGVAVTLAAGVGVGIDVDVAAGVAAVGVGVGDALGVVVEIDVGVAPGVADGAGVGVAVSDDETERIRITQSALVGIIHMEVPSKIAPMKAKLPFVKPGGQVLYPFMLPSEVRTLTIWSVL